MNTIFQWTNKNEKEDIIETSIASYIEDRVNVCHTGNILINLGFLDPLNFWVKGTIVCSCGRRLISFSGDQEARKIEFIEI